MENWHWTRISELAGCREASSMFSAGLANWTAKDGNSDSSNTVFFKNSSSNTVGIAEESGGIGCCTVGRQA
jgi:hypothetical protein